MEPAQKRGTLIVDLLTLISGGQRQPQATVTDYLLRPLDACFARVQRAGEHLDDFRNRVEGMLKKQAYAAGITLDPKPPYQVKVTLPPETFFDMGFGILIGEIFYNLRRALDYLVFELAKLDSGVEQNGTQFPIVDTKKDFDAGVKGRSWVKGVNAAHIAAIERLQPYNGCNWTKRLRDCSNPDKHRYLVQAGGNVKIYVHSSLEKELADCWGYQREIPHPVAGQLPVRMKVYPTGDITFSDGGSVLKTVGELTTQIVNTLTAFKREF